MRDITPFLDAVRQWAADHADVAAVLLVGSFARGTAHSESDVDLVVIMADPLPYLADAAWLSRFGVVTRVQDEDWGLVQSRRTWYAGGLEVEFGLTTRQWVATDPVDPGTREDVTDGAAIVYDPAGILAALLAAISSE